MGALQSQLPPKHRLSHEWRRALQLLASNPRGTTEDMLVVGHGFSADMLAMLVLAGLAKVVTATLKAEGGTFTIERLHITDRSAGDRKSIEREPYSRLTDRNAAAAAGVGLLRGVEL